MKIATYRKIDKIWNFRNILVTPKPSIVICFIGYEIFYIIAKRQVTIHITKPPTIDASKYQCSKHLVDMFFDKISGRIFIAKCISNHHYSSSKNVLAATTTIFWQFIPLYNLTIN